jgi:hypothetical protein
MIKRTKHSLLDILQETKQKKSRIPKSQVHSRRRRRTTTTTTTARTYNKFQGNLEV